MSANAPPALTELDRTLEGDVLGDPLSRMLYATDASPYQQLPRAIARPRGRNDCIAVMQFAARQRLPLIPRAAGTSLAGQCVGEGLVVDCSRYMNQILEVDGARRRVRVQPGVIRDDLNEKLRPQGLMFAPDPSTSNRCTVGGMLGNNASGIHGLRYGTTREHVHSVEAVLSDGSVARFGPLRPEALEEKLRLENLEGQIYRTVYHLIEAHRDLILLRFPRPDHIPRNAGYALDVLASGQPWVPQGPAFNLARLLCGSEGGLALVTEIELNLVPLPTSRKLLCIHFEEVDRALKAVAPVLSHGPAALELVDRHILALTQNNLEQRRNRFWLQGDPGAVLLAEFTGQSDQDLDDQLTGVLTELRGPHMGYAHVVLDPPEMEQAWTLRKAGLGLLMGIPGRKKAVTGIEDTAVAVADLPAYVRDMQNLMARHGTECVIYGPVGRGMIHFRPQLDLASEQQKFTQILEEVADLVIRYRGTLSAKHGDGRLRAPFLERLMGREIIKLLQAVKQVFDPHDLLNPHASLDNRRLTEHLRLAGHRQPVSTHFDWRRQGGFETATSQCNGAGVCLKTAGHGTMCPSYMATREEKHGTRGRANIFRQVMANPAGWAGEDAGLLREALDLCLSCKGCKAECPANVDMARMKAEFLQHYHDRFGLPRRARLVGNLDRLIGTAGRFPRLSNVLSAPGRIKSLLGFHPQRPLPPLAPQRFSHQLRQRPADTGQGETVVLFNDLFTEYYEPHIGIAALEVLNRLGCRVRITPCLESGRIQISQGMLRQARERLTSAVEQLYPHAAAGRFIVGLEPSEVLTFRDEAVDLLADGKLRQKARRIAEQILLFEEFIAKKAASSARSLFSPLGKEVLVHGHCHEKALVGMEPLLATLSVIPDTRIEAIPSGCCGMAGIFGYEKEHYEISLAIAELVLLPAIRQADPDSLVVAPGTSCRRQILDCLGVRAYHPAEVLHLALEDDTIPPPIIEYEK
ncbi:FAD-binding and (Fe-S)-binding domain-containing protein [Methylohalobius crimeensis]|uniref:FAD-binding and (Fe-S)-binding domain-containing protein n=1 Tax=Methylohalobius crimeensis TaxID=244365 RepID=UPI0004291312|nr:FAD-binding and (Fe-S)-binding domain-containing protein [Methylohalobius crimeensis]